MLKHLMREEVHAVLQALSDLYVKGGKGYWDRNITLVRESGQNDGVTESTTGFAVSFDTDAVTLGVGAPDVRHETVPLSNVVKVIIER
jgi:hypothetical protein